MVREKDEIVAWKTCKIHAILSSRYNSHIGKVTAPFYDFFKNAIVKFKTNFFNKRIKAF